ncbi:MAG: efflux RND transporter periplasmic adaptor subunit [Desulfobacteraceae bacterium]|nr:MAG: efflux RND transporter periplasmic adaptor subunit [Desulfobacteraceae bacterium]
MKTLDKKGCADVNIKISIKYLITAVIIMLAVFWLMGCGNGTESENAPDASSKTVKAAIHEITSASRPIYYEATGTVRPKTASTISARVMGEIKEITVNAGDTVKKDQVLLRIEGRQISAGLQQAEAGLREAIQGEHAALSALQSAQASKALAESTYNRYKKLLETQSVSQQEFDEVEAKYRQAQAALSQAKFMQDAARERSNQAKAAVASAESAFEDTTLTSPYDGTITARLADAGDMASPGLPLVKIEETGLMEVHLLLPETHIGHVAIGDTVSVVFPSQKTEPAVTGTITTIDPSADPSTRSFQLKVTLPETPGIRAGMFARVMIPVGEAGMILVPKTAVVQQGQLTAVFIVGNDQIARFRLIRQGRAFNDQVEVVSGLKDGDRCLAAPDAEISDGVKVEGI